MNAKSFLIALMSVMIAFQAQAQLLKKVSGNDKYVTKELKLSDFTKVSLSHAFNVIYKVNPDSAGIVRIYAEENIMEMLSIKSEKGKLSMKLNSVRDPQFGVILVHMYSNALQEVKCDGSGTFEIQTPIESPEISLSVTGSGQIKAESVTCGVLEASVGGSGDILVSGNVGFADLSVQGSGEIRALGLKAESGNAIVTGSGEIRCNVEKELKTVLTGSGKVYYEGKPAIKSRTVGSGQVIQL